MKKAAKKAIKSVKPPKPPRRLINIRQKEIGDKYLSNKLLVLAQNIEEALLMAGATPGDDYTYLELIDRAIPFALVEWEQGHLSWELPPPDEV